mgnify:CR=1 FL=1
MSTKHKLLIVGCGKHLLNTMSHHLLRLKSAALVCCVDPITHARHAARDLLRCGSSCAAIEEVDFSTVSAAIVATPPYASFAITNHLIERHIPVLVEKPPAMNSADIATLDEKAQRLGVRVQVGFNFRFAAAYRALRNVCEKHPPALLSCHFVSRHPASSEWGVSDPREAWLRHNGVHLLDMVRSVSGALVLTNAERTSSGEGRHLACVALHSASTIIQVIVGNMTSGFSLGMTAILEDGRTFQMRGLGSCVEVAYPDGPVVSTLYATKSMDDGWDRLGYGAELDAFLSDDPNIERPNLGDALNASLMCDALCRE